MSTRFKDCPDCDGYGHTGYTNEMDPRFDIRDPGASYVGRDCVRCDQSGRVQDVDCEECQDTGVVEAYLIRHDAPEGSEAERITVPCPECGED